MDMTFLRPVDFVHDEWAVVYVGKLQVRTSACPRAARNGGGGAPDVIGAAEPLQCVDAVSSGCVGRGEGCTVETFVGDGFFDGSPP
jgi:hypothetical protein